MTETETKKVKFSLQCPIPALDFDKITLAHGSGGLLTHQLLQSGVFDLLKNEHLDTHHDGALLDINGPVAFTTDSYVITPVFFPGGNIGELAVNGTLNDLAMCGAKPKFISLSFIIDGLSIIRIYARVFLGPHVKSQYDMAYRSS